ncbi:hypothetical protein DDZ18_04200 [Marinicauda salina]|uniref:Peptidoglycan binding-like domain-containing protein n=1 Tax=Marinicauda salina TaxID=2135793 RepID=A0A2U2BXS0_9PROT|nr:DUF1036 domain-containing protein [Marinicauda salina]PWE18800.1 hypothetical protein DDZ18_04200 [Marinicauda salina]
MMLRLLIAAAAAFGAAAFVTAPARAGEVCNETSFVVEAAKAWRTESGIAAEGWSRILPGGCADMGPDADIDQYLYARSTPAYLGGVREWRGSLEVCVDEADFAFEGVADCEALGLETRGFRRLSEAERTRALLVEPADFGDRADEAGLQRLLQAAGYDIQVIDGYAGRRTRRQVARFESDAGREFDANRAALLEALHAAALERNVEIGLHVCNDADAPLAVAAAQPNSETEGWESRGWWHIEPGACARPIAERLDADDVYFYAVRLDPGAHTPVSRGTERFCIAPARFLAEGRDNCEERGYDEALFRTAPGAENGRIEVRLRDEDFEDAA